MRIVHVITRLIVGGAQENTILTCRGLAARGHDVTLVAGPEAGPEGSLLDDARATGARVLIHPHLRRDPSPVHDPLAVAALYAAFRALRPHVVHTHSSKAGIVGRLAARLVRTPAVVHTNHGLPFHDSQPAPVRLAWRALERIASRATDRIVCVGRDMVEASVAARLGPRRLFTVVRSGIDSASFRDEVHAGPRDVPVVGTIARIAPQKGPEHFVAAAKALASDGVRCVWVGDGPLRAEMEREAAGAVRFVGLVRPSDVPRHLRAMDVVLMTSLWEGLPRVAVQAALCGRPVVAFDAPGIREVVTPGVTGTIVPRGDVPSLVAATREVLARPDRGRSLGLEARRRVASEFDAVRMVDALERLYETLVPAALD